MKDPTFTSPTLRLTPFQTLFWPNEQGEGGHTKGWTGLRLKASSAIQSHVLSTPPHDPTAETSHVTTWTIATLGVGMEAVSCPVPSSPCARNPPHKVDS